MSDDSHRKLDAGERNRLRRELLELAAKVIRGQANRDEVRRFSKTLGGASKPQHPAKSRHVSSAEIVRAAKAVASEDDAAGTLAVAGGEIESVGFEDSIIDPENLRANQRDPAWVNESPFFTPIISSPKENARKLATESTERAELLYREGSTEKESGLRVNLSVPSSIETILGSVFPTGDPHWFWSLEGFRPHIESLSGSETEARELSLGILVLTSGAWEDRAPAKFPESRDCPQLSDIQFDLEVALNRETDTDIGQMLIEIAPFFPGGGGRPLLVLWYNAVERRIRVLGGRIFYSSDTAVRDTHEVYRGLTKEYGDDVSATVVWLKPARAVRVYHGGDLLMQSIQLRKTQKRCYRSPIRLIEELVAESARRGLEVKRSFLERIASVCVELSEERAGGAIYIMDRQEFEDSVAREVRGTGEIRIAKSRRVFGHERSEIDFGRLPFGTLLQMVREDGATVVSPEGKILAVGAYFDGVGGRRGTARHVCCRYLGPADNTDAAALLPPVVGLVVSQDGDVFVTGESGLETWS